MHTRRILAVLLAVCGVAFASTALAANAAAPTGTWRLMKDSDGKVPKPGAIVELTFRGGSFALKAVQPGETVEDSGSVQVSGHSITLDFRTLAQGKVAGPFTLSADTLVLPFRMLSEGPGWSMWMTPTALDAFLAKVPRRPPGPESIPDLLARQQKVAEAFGNAKERTAIDQRASAQAPKYKGGQAEAYYAIGTSLFLRGFYREAWYAFARASVLQPMNAVYLHNLSAVLQEIGSAQDARTILEWVTKNYPNLDPPWGSLGIVCVQLHDAACAGRALERARALAPENGLYDYAQGRLLASEGKATEAQRWYARAWSKGYGGSGNEGGRGGGR
ncbi:MAG: tetratricopeptide repeat protein [Gammaproteobacteria bacterium]|nr:tetratricopeptide repeat protein [Gammaproteobacteria bacterium]